MKELSVFIDESGDFGEFESHCPYYIITMVFHDQDVSIQTQVDWLDHRLSELGFSDHCVHTGPIIRNEQEYHWVSLETRKRIFMRMVSFTRQVDFRYKSFSIAKKELADPLEAIGRLSKQIAIFIRDHYADFLMYDLVKVYYDNGQVEVSKMLASVFNALLPNVEFRRVLPKDYRLFQTADLICSLELIRLKLVSAPLSRSEKLFFENERTFRKNYMKPILKKEWQ